jgi:predicted DNA-binding transcriptional regulator AlpA
MSHQKTRGRGTELVALDGSGLQSLLNVCEVAALLRCSASSLNKWRLDGSGPMFVRVGSRVRYRRADVIGWVNAQTRSSTSQSAAE